MKDFSSILQKAKKLYKRLGKREKFVLVASLEGVLFFITLSIPSLFQILFILATIFVALTTVFCLREELSDVKYLLLLILPVFFWGASIFFVRVTLGSGFWYLLAAILYSISRYSLLLTLNIYNVAAIRTIQLVRAANSVGLLFTLVSAFFIFSLTWGVRPAGWVLSVFVAFFSFPLILQSLWSIELENFVSRQTIIFSLVLTLALAELALSFSFWPILPIIGALALVSAMYVLLGMTHSYFTQKFNKRTIWEYLGIAGLILVFILVTTRWGG